MRSWGVGASALVFGLGSARVEATADAGLWRAGATIELSAVRTVAAGDTLRIEAGARVVAQPGAALIVERGGVVLATGTMLQPIVFSCVRTTNTPTAGCWRGLVIQGHAPVNAGTMTSPPAPRTGLAGCRERTSDVVQSPYGGCDADDGSGRLEWVRIEYAIDGLRLEGVGRGTAIAQVETIRSRQDGFFIDGGTVDLRRIVANVNDRAGMAWTRGWRGRAQEVIVLAHPWGHLAGLLGENAPTAADADAAPRAEPSLANVTVVAPSDPQRNPHHDATAAIRLARGSGLRLTNALIVGARTGLDLDDAATCAAVAANAVQSVIMSGVARPGDPDADPAPCADEALRLGDATQRNQVLGATPALVRPFTAVTPDLRPLVGPAWTSLIPTALAPDGFFDVTDPFIGAVRPTSLASVPWFSGWTRGMPTGGTPVATVAVSALQQPGVAGAAVPDAPRVRGVDAAGAGIAGLRTTWEVLEGGGFVTTATTWTDLDGVASPGAWTLGPRVGRHLLRATFDGLPAVEFRSQAVAPPGVGWLEVVPTTDGQSAAAGTNVPLPPAVLVRGPGGLVAPGVPVTFAIESGGGTLTQATVTSGIDGIARAGGWRLGPPGAQSLLVSAGDRLGARVTALATTGGVPTLVRETVLPAGTVQTPWDLAFTPDGTMLLTDVFGVVLRWRAGMARPDTLARMTDVTAQNQSGLLGLAVDPAFASNRLLYTYQSFGTGSTGENRVVRWRVRDDWRALEQRTVIVSGISYAGGAHSGGRMAFGTDGMLWIGTGDTRVGGVPQDLRVLGGKVLRVTRDGLPAPGNPTLGPGSDPRIYAFGMRNVQGLAPRVGGQMLSCEHGPNAADEVTLLQPGGNGGWHPLRDGDPYWEYRGYEGIWPMTDLARYPGAMRPTWSTGGVSEGMGPCTFLRGGEWGSWDGALVVALMSGNRMMVLSVTADGSTTTAAARFWPTVERVRALALAPDGWLYGLNQWEGVWRMRPQ
jgi:glucose/arabinose dehydrogenase